MTALVESYAGLVVDLDGCVYRGPEAVPGAVEALNALGVPVVYATNNASRPPAEVHEHLASLGIRLDVEHVLNASMAGAAALHDHVEPGSAVIALGGPGVAQALQDEGFRVVAPGEVAAGEVTADEVAAVLQGYGLDVRAADLAEAAYAIQHGAVWVATNDDRTLPTDRGRAPGNGAFVGALRCAVDVDPVVVGKPHPPLYQRAAAILGVHAGATLAVGDRLETDIAGAHATGMDCALVLTGVHGVADAATAAPDHRPTYLLADLGGLLEPYRAPERDGDWWVCGDARARWDGRQAVTEGPAGVEQGRCVLAATWQAADAR